MTLAYANAFLLMATTESVSGMACSIVLRNKHTKLLSRVIAKLSFVMVGQG